MVFSLFLLLLWPAAATAQRGAITRPANLAQLVDQAEVILRGSVVNARVEPHPQFNNLYTIVITLRPEEVLKGEVGETYTFRQYIWDIRDRFDAAGYQKGQRLLLLINKPSQYGLTSPAGNEQGRFRLLRDREGREFAVNGHANAGLFRNVETYLSRKGVQLTPRLSAVVAKHRTGAIELKDLEEIIRSSAGAQ